MVKTTDAAPMETVKTLTKLKWWPTPQDYNEAVQNPHVNFSDAELQSASIFVGSLGLPRPVCGAFASVYRVRSSEKEFAVRCFLRNTSDQEARYRLVSEFVQNDTLPYTVGFEFAPEGIKIRESWFPLLKMDWVAGQTLEQFVVANLSNRDCLMELADRFLAMCDQLRESGIAHGDLQHGNILVIPGGELRLVDYDGMYVPAMSGFKASEVGHRNYQHPARSGNHFGPYLDNFSAWVIYASLKILSIDPLLFNQLGGGDDCLLFKKTDFVDPLHSQRFALLESHSNPEVKHLAQVVRANLDRTLDLVPALKSVPPVVHVPTLKVKPSKAKGAAAPPSQMALPDWLQEEIGRTSSLPEWLAQSNGHFVESPKRDVVLKVDQTVVEAELRQLQIQTFNAALVPRKTKFINSDLYGNPYWLLIAAVLSALLAVYVLQGTPGVWFTLAAISAAFLCLNTPSDDEKLVARGIAAPGRLISVDSTAYSYSFSTSAGPVVSIKKDVPASVIEKLRDLNEKDVIVIYDENSPKERNVVYSISRARAVH